MKHLAPLVLLLVSVFQAQLSHAHALDPGYLELSAMGEGQWRVAFRIPDVSGRPMPLAALLPAGCEVPTQPEPRFDGVAWATTFMATCPDGLAGGEVRIVGLENTRTDALVRYELTPGQAQTHRLTSDSTAFVIPAEPGQAEILLSYISLGVTHILEGVDHLLFVLALLLLIRSPKRLIWTITAFTVAHSITLAAAAFGWLTLPSPPVEVVIALSIVFLAYELALPEEKRDPVAMRFPALVSFGFGLIHGLGFAGALKEIGLPQGDIPLALFSFNVGVELGQLLFIAVVLSIGLCLKQLSPGIQSQALRFNSVASYVIGSLAAFWFLQRLSGF